MRCGKNSRKRLANHDSQKCAAAPISRNVFHATFPHIIIFISSFISMRGNYRRIRCVSASARDRPNVLDIEFDSYRKFSPVDGGKIIVRCSRVWANAIGAQHARIAIRNWSPLRVQLRANNNCRCRVIHAPRRH